VSTVRALLAQGQDALAAAGVSSPRVDAELLLAHVLGGPRGRLPVAPPATESQVAAYSGLVSRRAAREPLQYLLGTAAFRHLELAVGPGVFIPRPETELLVDAVLAFLSTSDRPSVVDLCAGSGALGLSVHQECPTAQVIAIERSPDALAWLRRNAAALADDGRFAVVAADIVDPELVRDPIVGPWFGSTDVVLCNPPYVPSAAAIDLEVEHDPASAVFAGADGMALMPAVSSLAARLLRPGGVVAVEHSDGHGVEVVRLFSQSGDWVDVVDQVDLAGRDRYVVARRAPA
jgi:release factor glutamine methyltransferase